MPILLLNASLPSHLLTLAWIFLFFLQPSSVLSEKKKLTPAINFISLFRVHNSLGTASLKLNYRKLGSSLHTATQTVLVRTISQCSSLQHLIRNEKHSQSFFFYYYFKGEEINTFKYRDCKCSGFYTCKFTYPDTCTQCF